VTENRVVLLLLLLPTAQWRVEVRWCPGRLLDWMPPLPNSIEQWRMVVIATEYTLFVTSQYDVIFMFANQRFGEVC